MAPLATFEVLIRGGAIALFVLWIGVLLRQQRGSPAGRVAITMNVSILAYLVAPLFGPGPVGHPAFMAFDLVSVMAPVLFWLFARAWFEDRAHIGRRSWGLVVGYALLPSCQLTLMIASGRINLVLWILSKAAMFGFTIAGIWIAWRGRSDDLVEERRNLRLLLVGAIGAFTLWVTAFEMARHGSERHDLGHIGTIVAILMTTLGVSIAMYGFRPADLFAAPAPATEPPEDGEPAPAMSRLAARLLSVMANERPYRAEGFAIAALAQRLGEPEYRLRRTINGELGYRNFTAFLNGFRLDEVREALADPAQRDVPILTVAIDAGFGSIGPFNRAFREAEGMTPSEYRAARLAGKPMADSEIG
ncbi:helix-turn-helix domain-containing protein [Novosphingobium sp. G106]|uniref:AraC family transcriptional regulator n=1 Tax=Novosphingobium sp. G106 TaxID=2849500 RepID=UPI001C2DE066|nr:helix-turn-helix domain-containing protein [Novosphingobium sp. G106]MBV1689634.1 helix-turn-helix domain-containing protein [Novosphingobium sp. G106]